MDMYLTDILNQKPKYHVNWNNWNCDQIKRIYVLPVLYCDPMMHSKIDQFVGYSSSQLRKPVKQIKCHNTVLQNTMFGNRISSLQIIFSYKPFIMTGQGQGLTWHAARLVGQKETL